VYALAATLYHLATDDDPGAQPFAFPRLAALGPLGVALRPALDCDPRRRPGAAELRQRLEAVIAGLPFPQAVPAPQLVPAAPVAPAAPASGFRPPLRAIDGAELRDDRELAAWCERNWDAACDWLYSNLPRRVADAWGDAGLARQLDAIPGKYGRRDAGLAAALALLDPRGYGASPPRLSADRHQIDFGVVNGRERSWLIVANGIPTPLYASADSTTLWIVAMVVLSALVVGGLLVFANL